MGVWKGLLPGLLFAAMLGALARLLSPESGTRRILRLVTTLFLVTSVLAAVTVQGNRLTLASSTLPQDYAEKAVLDAAKQAIEQTARQALDAHGLADAQIVVTMTVRDGEAHTDTFTLFGVPPESAQEIRDEIFARTGERPDTAAGMAPQTR